MITHVHGDLLSATPDELDAIAHGCNCQGVMGAGIAKAVRAAYGEEMFQAYEAECALGIFKPGSVQVYTQILNRPILFNLAIQDQPGANARYLYVAQAIQSMVASALPGVVTRIGIPKIGAGIGGLKWEITEEVIANTLQDFPNIEELIVYSL
jgi:O-acetyl-ADP-ribose deacetylase (regulator of RNase III)